jgi:SpoVK/Ycf46/Vps4 family AAA+-type ATPase
MLGKREKQGEHEAMRKIKNEFMSLWDGLKTQEKERVIVLGATNRPMDLDDAVLRRMPRRLLVDLPDTGNREKILRVILKDEKISPNFDYLELAKITEGFTGSDLKNLCIAAVKYFFIIFFLNFFLTFFFNFSGLHPHQRNTNQRKVVGY